MLSGSIFRLNVLLLLPRGKNFTHSILYYWRGKPLDYFCLLIIRLERSQSNLNNNAGRWKRCATFAFSATTALFSKAQHFKPFGRRTNKVIQNHIGKVSGYSWRYEHIYYIILKKKKRKKERSVIEVQFCPTPRKAWFCSWPIMVVLYESRIDCFVIIASSSLSPSLLSLS